MGQKANIITLRNSKKNFNFSKEYESNFLFFFKIGKLLDRLFILKNTIVNNFSLNLLNNQTFFSISVYFKYSKTEFYKKKRYIFDKVNKTSSDNFLWKQLFSFFKINLVILRIQNLNLLIDEKILNSLYSKIRYSKKILFARRHTLFIDFLGLSSLFFQGHVTSNVYLNILGVVFSSLSKRRHKTFLMFLERLFTIFLNLPSSDSSLSKSKIKGLKFILSGRIQAKLRSSKEIIQVGKVPSQSIEKNIEFSKIHVYTLFGAFGLKLWVYRN